MTLFRFALMALAMLLAVPTVQAQMLGMSLISTTSAGLIYSAGISVTTNQTSVTSLYASGNVAITGNTSASIISVTAIQVVSQSSSPVTCNSGNSGALRYNSPTTALELCTGSGWQTMGVGIPAGTISAFASTTCPTGWSEYTAARGRFLRGIDNGAGNDPNGTRSPGGTQADAFQGFSPQFNGSGTYDGATLSGGTTTYPIPGYTGGGVSQLGRWSFQSDGTNGTPRTSSETRPKNVAVIFCQFNGTSNGWNNPLSGGSTSAAGNTTEVQYNGGSGAFGSSSNFTYNNGAGLLTAPNISTSNISVSTINGTPVGNLGSASKLASLTDVDVSGKVSGSVLVYNGGTTSWTTLPIQNVMSTTTMFTGWPDAIVCNVTAPTALGNAVFFAELMPYVSGLYYYRNHTNGTNFDIIFNSNGSFNSYSGITSANCNTTISSLYSSGRAFNFIGGSNANDSIVSGTTGLTAISNTNTISITTNNVVTGYFNSNGVLTVPGISATSNLTSVTTLYASGNVGIGTTAPQNKLEVSGSIRVSGADSSWTSAGWRKGVIQPQGSILLWEKDGSGVARGIGSSYNGYLYIARSTANDTSAAPTYDMIIDTSGNVGIGVTPAATLHVAGTFKLSGQGSGAGDTYTCWNSSTGSVTYSSSACNPSDIRLKKDIKTLPDALNKVMLLRGVTFEWKKESKVHHGPQIGLIAQEVEKVFPSVVATGDDGFKSVSYDKLVAPLIEAVKELKADNDHLRADFEDYKRTHP